MSASVLRQLQFAVAAWREDGRTDAELLARFTQDRDEQAFSTLVGRHGGLVWGVCVRRLGNRCDAEDAFQATFLRLAKNARAVRRSGLLPNWLYRTARYCAADIHRTTQRLNRIRCRLADKVNANGESERDSDLAAYLETELAQLPHQDRALLLMCVVDGHTYSEAAREFGCSVASIHRRLVRAQELLRNRLARHPAIVSVGVASLPLLGAVAPSRLQAETMERGLQCSRSHVYPDSRAGVIAAGSARTSAAGHTFSAAAVGIAVVLIAFAICSRPSSPPSSSLPSQAMANSWPAPRDTEAASPRVMAGSVKDEHGNPLPDAQVSLLFRDPYAPGARGLRDSAAVTTLTDEHGKFQFTVPDVTTWFPERVFVIKATAPGRGFATTVVRGDSYDSASFCLQPREAVTAKLTDDRQLPIQGSLVRVIRIGDAVFEPPIGAVKNPPPGWPEAVRSDRDGRFTFPQLAGCPNVWFRTEMAGFVSEPMQLDGRASYELTPGAEVEFTLTDRDNRAIGGARVTVVTDRPRSHAFFTDYAHSLSITKRSATGKTDVVADAGGRLKVTLPVGQQTELLIHPPSSDEPLVGVRMTLEPVDRTPIRKEIRLPRGEWVCGTIRDAETGNPIVDAVVHWGREDAKLPEWRDDILVGRDAFVRTDERGKFRVAVMPGACTVRVYGGTHEYASDSVRLPSTDTTLFAHAIKRVDVAVNGLPDFLDVRLRKGNTVSGIVDAGSAFVLASGRVSPVRAYSVVPIPIRHGKYEIPGCEFGVVTRAYFFDPTNKLGAVVDVPCDGNQPGPRVRLTPCGSATLRLVDSFGVPVDRVPVKLSLLVERTGSIETDPNPVDWFDSINYPDRTATNADGVVHLPALIPGGKYAITIGSGSNKIKLDPFVAVPNETIRISATIDSMPIAKEQP